MADAEDLKSRQPVLQADAAKRSTAKIPCIHAASGYCQRARQRRPTRTVESSTDTTTDTRFDAISFRQTKKICSRAVLSSSGQRPAEDCDPAPDQDPFGLYVHASAQYIQVPTTSSHLQRATQSQAEPVRLSLRVDHDANLRQIAALPELLGPENKSRVEVHIPRNHCASATSSFVTHPDP